MIKPFCKFYLFILISITVFTVALFTSCNESGEAETTEKEIYVWSHNDYEQERPLFKALELGFQMIEADIHLIDGALRVTHDHPENPEEISVLEDQYIKPLVEIIRQNNGVVLPESTVPFYLVIDVKTEAEASFHALMEVLEPYRNYFTRLENGEWIKGPIRLLISGNRPQLSTDDTDRMAFIDGRLPDIGRGLPNDLYPIISDNWRSHFTWNGDGDISPEEFEKLQTIVSEVHDEGKIIRFWATPDKKEVWDVLLSAGVDVINVDDLEKMRNYLDGAL
ncbi:MAG: hypothetical protein EA359_02150 [Balneolaceae bacterium]|nr:MAG: hypothetical protein EA359_02150 [Balneolaceae bacterium]